MIDLLQEKSFSFSSTRGYYSGITPPYTENFDKGKRENPHKYVLYKPSITQIMMFLATGTYNNPYPSYKIVDIKILISSTKILKKHFGTLFESLTNFHENCMQAGRKIHGNLGENFE